MVPALRKQPGTDEQNSGGSDVGTTVPNSPVNVVQTSTGNVRPVCEFCGCRGRAVRPTHEGTVSMWSLARGWSVAPYPLGYVHDDGSTGDLFQCSRCTAALSRGETLRTRQHG